MYKVFFKESSFLLSDNHKILQNDSGTFIHREQDLTCKYICGLLQQPCIFHAKIYHPDIHKLFTDFTSCFKVVGAAGGVVKDSEKILTIKRFGLYDLPKGHIEKEETTATCALREVEEECGVKELAIQAPLSDTWHIYLRDGIWHLKQTHWFAMTCPPGQTLTPQTEEDIEEVLWLPQNDIDNIIPHTYLSLRQIWEEAKSI